MFHPKYFYGLGEVVCYLKTNTPAYIEGRYFNAAVEVYRIRFFKKDVAVNVYKSEIARYPEWRLNVEN